MNMTTTPPTPRLLLATCLAFLVLAAITPPAVAQDSARPLRMEGKRTLYQRVLTRLGAQTRREPGAQAEVIARIPPFSIFYVYATRSVDGAQWLRVGPSSNGDISGWIAAEQLVEWKQTLVAFFTKPGNRQPALLFRERDTLTQLLESELGSAQAAKLREAAGEGKDTGQIVAVEPPTYVDPRKNFYLLPILDHIEADDDFATKALKVAVVNEKAHERAVTASGDSADPMAEFKVAIAFVIDTSKSMGPYIEQTRNAIRRICEKTQTTEWRDRFNFALIAFRDSLEATRSWGIHGAKSPTSKTARTARACCAKRRR